MTCYLIVLMILSVSMADNHRSKRFLIFPPTSPTRVQIITGIGVPIGLDFESVVLGWVVKAEYYLPDNTTLTMHFAQDPFNPITHPITSRRKRNPSPAISSESDNKFNSIGMQDNSSSSTVVSYDADDELESIEMQTNSTNNTNQGDHYEKYDVEAVEIGGGNATTSEEEEEEEDDDDEDNEDDDRVYTAADYRISKPNDFATARWSLFKSIEMLAERSGLAGRPCMLRSICESAHAPFTFKSGILGELMHIIMTPSSTMDTINDHSQNEYLRAEELGRSGAPCEKIFKECPRSLLDRFTGIYGSMENLIKLVG